MAGGFNSPLPFLFGMSGAPALVPLDLATSAPVLDQPAITQVHALTVSDIAAGGPSIDQPAVTQVHALTVSDIATSGPVLDAATVTQVHSLASTDLATAGPALDKPTVTSGGAGVISVFPFVLGRMGAGTGSDHSLVSTDLATAAPTLDKPTLTQSHVLSANDIIVAASVSVDVVSLSQVHALSPGDIATASPVVDSVSLTQLHQLTVADLVTGAPTIQVAQFALPVASEELVNWVYIYDRRYPSATTPTIGTPFAAFSWDLTNQPTVRFINESVGATSHVWNFDDNGAASTLINPEHTFNFVGDTEIFNVCLTINGDPATQICQSVTVGKTLAQGPGSFLSVYTLTAEELEQLTSSQVEILPPRY